LLQVIKAIINQSGAAREALRDPFFWPYTRSGLLFLLSCLLPLSPVVCSFAPNGQSVNVPQLRDIFQHQPFPQLLSDP